MSLAEGKAVRRINRLPHPLPRGYNSMGLNTDNPLGYH